jgi:hypothetical protein
MDDQSVRQLAEPFTIDLVDELLRRLGLGGQTARVEIEVVDGRALKVWTHRPYKRSELVRFDPA